MGTVIKKNDLPSIEQVGLGKLIIYCNPEKKLVDTAIPINILLAKALTGIKPDRRTMRMERCVQNIMSTLPPNPTIKDFDVMFNPIYEIDVLQIFLSQQRIRPFRIIWPGKLQDGKLIYAEEGYRDYKVFDINNYDVACVI